MEALLPDVVDGALQLVLETQGPEVDLNSVPQYSAGIQLPSKFQPIYDEGQNWSYGVSK